jgi:hypothetical protein
MLVITDRSRRSKIAIVLRAEAFRGTDIVRTEIG